MAHLRVPGLPVASLVSVSSAYTCHELVSMDLVAHRLCDSSKVLRPKQLGTHPSQLEV